MWLASKGQEDYNEEGGEGLGLNVVLILGMDIGQIVEKVEHLGIVCNLMQFYFNVECRSNLKLPVDFANKTAKLVGHVSILCSCWLKHCTRAIVGGTLEFRANLLPHIL